MQHSQPQRAEQLRDVRRRAPYGRGPCRTRGGRHTTQPHQHTFNSIKDAPGPHSELGGSPRLDWSWTGKPRFHNAGTRQVAIRIEQKSQENGRFSEWRIEGIHDRISADFPIRDQMLDTIKKHLKTEFAQTVSANRVNEQVIITLNNPIRIEQLPALNARLHSVLRQFGNSSGGVPDSLLDAMVDTIKCAKIVPVPITTFHAAPKPGRQASTESMPAQGTRTINSFTKYLTSPDPDGMRASEESGGDSEEASSEESGNGVPPLLGPNVSRRGGGKRRRAGIAGRPDFLQRQGSMRIGDEDKT